MPQRRGTVAATAAALLVLVPVAGCGRHDFKNEPKPAVPIEATIEISAQKVDVSPVSFGAGLVNFVIANNSKQDASLSVTGPVRQMSESIPANGNGVFKIDMKTGSYKLGVDGNNTIAPATLNVGPERESSNNDLLLP